MTSPISIHFFLFQDRLWISQNLRICFNLLLRMMGFTQTNTSTLVKYARRGLVAELRHAIMLRAFIILACSSTLALFVGKNVYPKVLSTTTSLWPTIKAKRFTKYAIFTGNIRTFEDFDQYVRKDANGSKYCGLCFTFKTNHQGNLRNHIESKHFPYTFTYQCPDCNIVLHTNKAFLVHRSKTHKSQL